MTEEELAELAATEELAERDALAVGRDQLDLDVGEPRVRATLSTRRRDGVCPNSCVVLVGCDVVPTSTTLHELKFTPPVALPGPLNVDESWVRGALTDNEELESFHVYAAEGLATSATEVVAVSSEGARAFVITGDGRQYPTQVFWELERAARFQRFGRMTPTIFAQQTLLEPTDALSVQLTLDVDAPQITRPYDGTDQVTSVDEYLNWYTAHVLEVESKIDQGKNGVRALLNDNGATISSDPRALPVIVARIPVNVLRSEELNRLVINIEDPVESGVILGHAGRASMNAGALVGGGCGAGTCDGGNVIVGLWERDSSVTVVSGIAFNNTRLSTAGSAYSYLLNPATCAAQADCSDPGHPDVSRYCEPAVTSQACNLSLSCPLGQTCNAQHHCQYLQGRCVQDHLSWVAASVGMSGDYSYNTTWPGAADPTPNVPSGTLITASSPAHVQFKVGNDTSINGFDYVVSTSGGAAAPFVNESMSTTGGFLDWAGRAYGAFFAAAGGNVGGTDIVTCSQLRNGLCVGWYDYNTYNSVSSHRRTQNAAFGSNFINSPAVNVERPHLLGPGNHTGGNDGIHMPRIDATPGTNAMEWAYLPQAGGSPIAIAGSSFASPAVLSAAIQALQYEGWLSALAFPMVNKAVLLASTEDANADGAIGNTTRWSGQPSDAEDGAGQLNFTYIKQTLDNNQYYWDDVADSDFVSCGTNCRKITIPITIPIAKSARIALAWQSCMTAETGVPVITNDLDLVLNCGNPMVVCGGLYQSVSTADEIEMVQYPACNFLTPGCAIEVRIKNGAALQSCGSTTTERIGVAWALRP